MPKSLSSLPSTRLLCRFRNRLNILPGDQVLMAGQGPIGLIFIRLLSLRGINVIAKDLLLSRLKLAEQFGATVALNAADPHFEKILQRAAGRARHSVRVAGRACHSVRVAGRACHSVRAVGCQDLTRRAQSDAPHLGLDAAVIAVPSDHAVQQAQKLIRGGGQILLFAHTKRGNNVAMDLASVCVDEKDLIGSYSSDITLQTEVARTSAPQKETRSI